MSKAKTIKNVTNEIVFSTEFISVRRDTIEFSDGKKDLRDILQVPKGVVILPITKEGKIILTIELRHNHGKVYSVPMGKIDEDELDPVESAKRELNEEVGLIADKWTLISSHHNGVHEEGLNYFFVAENLTAGESAPEEDEDIEKAEVTFEQAFKLMDEGKIIDLRSRGCIWAGYIFLHRRGKQ